MYQCFNRCFVAVLVTQTLVSVSQADEKSPVKVERDLVFAEVDGRELTLDLYLPSVKDKAPLVVWIHGGGWRQGSKKKVPIQEITEHGFALASISYRFSETAVFPAQIHDCKSAVRWLRANAGKYDYNADWIAVAGSSAGGHLALLMGTSGGVEELEGDIGGNLDQSSTVQAVIDYFGPSDFGLRGKTQPDRAYTTKSGSFALLGGLKNGEVNPKLEALASPVTYVDPNDPPLLIFHGTDDKTVLLDQSERMVAAYREAGLDASLVVLEGAGHGGGQFFSGEHFKQASDFLTEHSRR